MSTTVTRIQSNKLFTAWEPMASLSIEKRLQMRDAMTQYCFQILNTWLSYSSEKMRQIDAENFKLPIVDGIDDAVFNHCTNKTPLLNGLWSLFFHKPFYLTIDETNDTKNIRDEQYEWLNIVIEAARVQGYQRWRDGRRFSVIGKVWRPRGEDMIATNIAIDCLGLHEAISLIKSLDVCNKVQIAHIVEKTSGNISESYARKHSDQPVTKLTNYRNESHSSKESQETLIATNWP